MSVLQGRLIDMPEKLKYLRKRDGVSQTELAKRVGLGRRIVAELETNKCPFTLRSVISYTDYFGLNLDEFLFDDFETFKNNEEKLLGVTA